MFEIGSYIIKPGSGICRIAEVLNPPLPGVSKDRLYYLLVPLDSPHSKLYVPTDTAEQTLRTVMTKADALALIDSIPEIEAVWIANDKLREQAYKEALQSCEPRALISIIKNLYLRRMQRIEQGKKSTSTDERYFKLAEEALYAELAFALEKEKGEMRQFIADALLLHKSISE